MPPFSAAKSEFQRDNGIRVKKTTGVAEFSAAHFSQIILILQIKLLGIFPQDIFQSPECLGGVRESTGDIV